MAFTVALKLLLSAVSITAVVAPISYFATKSNSLLKGNDAVSVDKCIHLPLKSFETKKKLLVCSKTGEDKPVFKWWTKSDEQGKKEQKINTLSWKEKTANVSTTKVFEMQMKLENQEEVIKEEGQEGFYLPYKEIDKLEEKCSLKISGSGSKLTFACEVTADMGERKSHTIIDTTDVVHSH